MELKSVKFLITAFVSLLIGISLITAISNNVNDNVDPTLVSSETLNIAPARLAGNNINTTYQFTLANSGITDTEGWVVNSVVITNSSGFTLVGNYSVNYATDRITFSNNTYMVTGGGANNITLASYGHYPSDYLNSSFGRTALETTVGLFGIALLLVAVGLFYAVAKEEGIL